MHLLCSLMYLLFVFALGEKTTNPYFEIIQKKTICNKNYNNIINSYIKSFGKDIYVNQMLDFYKTKMNLTDNEVKQCLNNKLLNNKLN
jgi:hypothetical protein